MVNKVNITGDTHIPADIHKLNKKKWPEQNEMTKEDYLVICGDCGLIWNYRPTGLTVPSCPEDDCWTEEELYWYKWLNEKPFTTLWVDGNHESFDRLKKYPVTEWHGGKVQMISDSIIHLMRGQVYEINGKTFFTMGGAESHDRGYATGTEKQDAHKIWWKEEIPSEREWKEAFANLKKHGNKVDYIITHEAPGNIKFKLGYGINGVSNRLWQIYDTVEFSKWYCGHLHCDQDCGKVRVMYYDIVECGE